MNTLDGAEWEDSPESERRWRKEMEIREGIIPSPQVRAGLAEMRAALESIPRLTADARERVWSAFGHLRDVLYREAARSRADLIGEER